MPLSDEQIDKQWRGVDYTIPYQQFRIDVARAIESAATAPLLTQIESEKTARIKAQEENISLKEACLKAESQAQRVPVLLAQIAALEDKVKAAEQASRWESDLCAQALDSMKQLEAQLAEARKDAERLGWLANKVHERPLRPASYGSEMFPDMRLCYGLPTMVSYDAIGQTISFRAAIDAAIAQEQPNARANARP